ncbi:hypothetical protein V6N13_125157 [Hibiscus sabdariffa]|uniref:Uncharacterized protein n=1 Tax=Hibiscus sabdariffa TaxID=183260 RepID=A0ABR2U4V5_9ROSI
MGREGGDHSGAEGGAQAVVWPIEAIPLRVSPSRDETMHHVEVEGCMTYKTMLEHSTSPSVKVPLPVESKVQLLTEVELGPTTVLNISLDVAFIGVGKR